MKKKSKYSSMIKIIRLSFGLALIFYLIGKFGFSQLIDTVNAFPIVSIIVVLLLTLLGYILASFNLIIMAKSCNTKIPVIWSVITFLKSISVSLFTPGRIGDFSLVWLWARYLDPRKTAFIIVIDKIVTTISLIAIFSVGINIGDEFTLENNYITIGIFLFIFGLIIMLIFFLGKMYPKLFPINKIVCNLSVREIIVTIFLKQKTNLIIFLIICFTRIFMFVYCYQYLLANLGVYVSLVACATILSAAQLSAILPISVMGIGVTETINIVMFSKIGINAVDVLSVNLLGRFISIFILLMFFIFINNNPINDQ